MDHDNPNLNDVNHDKAEWWAAKRAEMEARLEKMDAADRLKANDTFSNLSETFDVATDWTEASWDEFKAKVEQWWSQAEIKTDESI